MSSPSPFPPAFVALARHARARRPLSGEDDAERDLTEEGRAELERQCERLIGLGFACDAILHSPWLRARRTAERLARALGRPAAEHAGLASELDSAAGRALVEECRRAGARSRLVLVGHQPWLAELARELGAADVSDLDCGELIVLAPAIGGGFRLQARLAPG